MPLYNFKNINWGPDDAKGDDDLRLYFVPFPEFSAIRSGQYRYIIGRKGTGKTAVIEKIRLETENDPLSFRTALSLRDFPVQLFRELRDKAHRDKAQFVSTWQFLIYVEIAKLICKDAGAQPDSTIADLRAFLAENNLSSPVGFADTVTLLKKSEQKIKVSAKWLEGEVSEGGQVQMSMPVHFRKVAEILSAKLSQVSSDSQYWIFVDELDEGYRAGDQSLRLILLALLRATEDIALQFKRSHLTFRPLIVLRSDIFDRLEDNDLNKLDDHVLRLRWTARDNKDDYSLIRIPSARIAASIPTIKTQQWETVVNDRDRDLPKQVDSVWGYISNRTYERPRDIVKFLKYCAKRNTGGPLTFRQVQEAENDYSDWLYREIRDELHSYLECWKEALNCITQLGTGKLSVADYTTTAKANKTIAAWLEEKKVEPDVIIEMLFDFGIFGNLDDQRRWLFRYKDDDLRWNPEMNLIVHFGLNKKLRLIRDKRVA